MASRAVFEFISRRCRLQRLRDAKFVHAWVHSIDSQTVTVLTHVDSSIEVGDMFAVEVYGDMETILFQAHFKGLDKTVAANAFKKSASTGIRFELPKAPLVFTLVGPMTFSKSSQVPRKLADSYNAFVTTPIEVPAVIHDVSDWGVGMISSQRFEPNSKIQIAIQHEGRDVSLGGAVRYSRRETTVENMFRTGISIDELGRLELAKWRKFIADL